MTRRLGAVAACIVLLVAACVFLADRALHRPTQRLTAADRAAAREVGATLETLTIAAADGVLLQGWLFIPRRQNGHAVVLLHGIASIRAAMLPSVRLFLEHGYRALATDVRAHGDSGGGFGTFGALEAGDLRLWIARIASNVADGCVYAFGQSLGAAIALQASDAPGLCAVVAESGFASVREIAFDRVGQQLRTGPWAGRIALRPGIELGLLYARLRFGVNLAAASAVRAVAQPGVPILLVHGLQDDNTPVRHAEMIAAANRSRVSLWVIPGGGHQSLRHTAGADYATRVLSFLAAHLGPRVRS
jgi:alpha-beta hydrolase superfamily lysophospholipase